MTLSEVISVSVQKSPNSFFRPVTRRGQDQKATMWVAQTDYHVISMTTLWLMYLFNQQFIILYLLAISHDRTMNVSQLWKTTQNLKSQNTIILLVMTICLMSMTNTWSGDFRQKVQA
jgi:hypothetical protein